MGSPRISATFHLTHACNLRCGYCFTGEKTAVGMSEPTADTAIDFVIAEAARQGATDARIVFFGGEPLLRMDLIRRIVAAAVQRGAGIDWSFALSTNGTLLTRDLLSELARLRVFVSLSLDGDPAVQDAQRVDAAGNGTSRRLAEVIPDLLAWYPCANVTAVVTPASAAALDRSVRWIAEQGFGYITTTLDYAADWGRADLVALEAAYERLAAWYEERTLAGDRFYLSCFDERIRTHARGPIGGDERCEMGRRQFSIAPSGRLYPCIQFVREDDDPTFALGDVARGFDADRRGAVAGCAEADKAECGGCALKSRCSNWCACVNYLSTGRIDTASPVLCEHERLLMPIADRVANRLWKRRDPLFLHKHYNPAFPVLSYAERLALKEA